MKVTLDEGNALVEPYALSMGDFMQGFAEIKVIPKSRERIVLRAQHSFLKGISEPLIFGGPLFTDLVPSHANFTAISELKKSGVIAGYPDGSFKPDKGVSRVEALKLIFAGMKAEVPSSGSFELRFEDTSVGEWYAPYLVYALGVNVVSGYPDGTFKPENTVNKAEFAKMLVLALRAGETALPEDGDAASPRFAVANDVTAEDWFAVYVAYLLDKGYIDLIDGKFFPAEPMDRARVAEAIYRATR